MSMEYREILVEKKNMNILKVVLRGKLESQDYDMFVPLVERTISEYDKVRILLILEDFQGWTAGAVWEDTKFGFKHFTDIEKIAIIGDRKWEKGMEVFCKVFITGEARYFDLSQADEGRRWIRA